MTGVAMSITALAAGQSKSADGYVRLAVDAQAWAALAAGCAAGLHDLSALWCDDGHMHMALSDTAGAVRAIVSLATRNGSYPSVGRHHAPAIRLERAARPVRCRSS
jgi:hypothetical protein